MSQVVTSWPSAFLLHAHSTNTVAYVAARI